MVTSRPSGEGADVATVAVRVRAGARRAFVGGRYEGPYGPALLVSVTVPPVDGRATEAVLVALARALRLRRGELSLRTGVTSRDKLVAVSDSPADLRERVAQLRDAAG